MEAIARIEGELRREKPGHAHSSRQHEVELSGFFMNATAKIGPKRPARKFRIRADTPQGDKCILDPRRESDAMRQERFSELEVDHFRAKRDLPSVPAVTDGVGDRHHPRRHQRGSVLFGRMKVGQSMGEHIAGGQSDFLGADRDRGGDVSSLGEGRRHHRSDYQGT